MKSAETIQYQYAFPNRKNKSRKNLFTAILGLAAATMLILFTGAVGGLLSPYLPTAWIAKTSPSLAWVAFFLLFPVVMIAALVNLLTRMDTIQLEKTGVSVPSGSKRTPLRIPYADIRDLDITMLDNREIVLIISASRLGETVLYARGFAPYKKKSFGWESFLSFFAALQMRTGKHTPLKQQGIQEHRKKILSFPVLRFSYNVRIRHIALLAAMAAGCILYLSVRFINSPPKNPDLIFLLWRIPGRWVPDYDMALFLLLIVILIVTMGIGITTGLSAKNRIELSKTALVVPSARFKRKKEASYNEIRSVSVDCLRIPGYGRHPTARTVTVLWPGGKLTMNSSWFSNTDEFEIFVCVLNYRQALAAVFPPYRYN